MANNVEFDTSHLSFNKEIIMKSNRLFYIGLGCVLSTLLWTLTAAVVSDPPIYPYKDKKEILQVDHLICSEFSLVDANGIEVIAMFNLKGEDPVMVIKDLMVDKANLRLDRHGIKVYNSDNRSIIGIYNIEDIASLWAKNTNGQPTWIMNANSREPIQPPSPKK